MLFTLLHCRNYTPGTYNPNAHGSDDCRGGNRLWTITLDRYTRTAVSECVVSTEIKVPDPTGNLTRAAGLKGREFTDHAMGTD